MDRHDRGVHGAAAAVAAAGGIGEGGATEHLDGDCEVVAMICDLKPDLGGGYDIQMEETTVDDKTIANLARALAKAIGRLDLEKRVTALNESRMILSSASPFSDEPVDCVVWVPAEEVVANDYNPNSVAPPEMRLLELSIEADGYTQPIVAWETSELPGGYEVVDGFHRHRVGKESSSVRKRIKGFLPIVRIKADRQDKGDRIAATIRHNRARGKHQVDAMSEIVIELRRRNWSAEKIGKELGMDPDEVLRLTQIAGLAEMFADQEFSEAWDPGTQFDDSDLPEFEDASQSDD